jgi:hypothetical protein
VLNYLVVLAEGKILMKFFVCDNSSSAFIITRKSEASSWPESMRSINCALLRVTSAAASFSYILVSWLKSL